VRAAGADPSPAEQQALAERAADLAEHDLATDAADLSTEEREQLDACIAEASEALTPGG
jgi:hypothetical protein